MYTFLISCHRKFHQRQNFCDTHAQRQTEETVEWRKEARGKDSIRENNRDGCNNRSRNWFLSVQKSTTLPRGRLSRVQLPRIIDCSQMLTTENIKILFLGKLSRSMKVMDHISHILLYFILINCGYFCIFFYFFKLLNCSF